MKKEIMSVALASAVLSLSAVSHAAEDQMRTKSTNLTTAQQNCMELNKKREAAGKTLLNCDDSKTLAEQDRVKDSIAPMQK